MAQPPTPPRSGSGGARRGPTRGPRPVTDVQLRTLAFIHAHHAEHGFAPSTRDICAEMGWGSTNGALTVVKALEAKGLIARKPWMSRSITVLPAGLAALEAAGLPPASPPRGSTAPPPTAADAEALLDVARCARREARLRAAWLAELPPGSCVSPPPAELLEAEADTGAALAALEAGGGPALWDLRDDAARAYEQLDLLARMARDGDPDAAAMGRDLLAPGGLAARLRVRYREGGFDMHGAGWTVRLLATSLINLLDGKHAENYVEQEITMRAPGGTPVRAVVTALRGHAKTPHQLRREAEARADALEAEVASLRAALRAAGAAGRAGA